MKKENKKLNHYFNLLSLGINILWTILSVIVGVWAYNAKNYYVLGFAIIFILGGCLPMVKYFIIELAKSKQEETSENQDN